VSIVQLPLRQAVRPVHLALLLLLAAGLVAAPGSQAQEPERGGTLMTVAVMKTSMGEIVLRFFPDIAPKAVENFERLAKKGYYDGVIFHRVIDGFMIQGGDPLGTGYGGKSIWGVAFENETHPDYVFDRKGILAMANAGKDTNGSQFFITLAKAEWLDGGYTIFGEVVSGQEVVDEIGKVEVTPGNNKPVKPITIESVTIEERVVGE
jgi:peptidylprolyl isomerase